MVTSTFQLFILKSRCHPQTFCLLTSFIQSFKKICLILLKNKCRIQTLFSISVALVLGIVSWNTAMGSSQSTSSHTFPWCVLSTQPCHWIHWKRIRACHCPVLSPLTAPRGTQTEGPTFQSCPRRCTCSSVRSFLSVCFCPSHTGFLIASSV